MKGQKKKTNKEIRYRIEFLKRKKKNLKRKKKLEPNQPTEREKNANL
jgi:hypothetical protein